MRKKRIFYGWQRLLFKQDFWFDFMAKVFSGKLPTFPIEDHRLQTKPWKPDNFKSINIIILSLL